MRLAHLILCHKNPLQVMRMAAALQHPDSDIYIHVDKKVDITPFLPAADWQNVHFVQDRVKVYWGGYSIVQATLAGFRAILNSGTTYDYINLLSGQDYPLKPQAELHRFLTDNAGGLFINVFPDWHKQAEQERRLKQYYFSSVSIRGKYTAERIARMVKPRKFPEGFVPVGRSQWFTIPAECASYILRFIEDNKKIVNLFRFMWAPDEMMMQSILYNSPYQKQITNDNMRYVDWSKGEPSPKVLTSEDVAPLTQSGNLFARKFDMGADSAILDHIDAHIASQPQ